MLPRYYRYFVWVLVLQLQFDMSAFGYGVVSTRLCPIIPDTTYHLADWGREEGEMIIIIDYFRNK